MIPENKKEILRQILLEQVLPELGDVEHFHGDIRIALKDGYVEDYFITKHKKPEYENNKRR